MNDVAIVISAQETNKYHKKGDLAPFGDTTLLEWKISQCKECVDASQIYLNSNSEAIHEIALKENVNFIKREESQSYIELMLSTIQQIDADDILITNVNSPYINGKDYNTMYELFLTNNKRSIVSVEEKKEYVFYEGQKLNFSDQFISRSDIEPIYIMTGGCYIATKEEILANQNIVGKAPQLYLLDAFSAIEIKDINDYSIARDLISIYFKNEYGL